MIAPDRAGNNGQPATPPLRSPTGPCVAGCPVPRRRAFHVLMSGAAQASNRCAKAVRTKPAGWWTGGAAPEQFGPFTGSGHAELRRFMQPAC